jgi:hypothetical protein
MTIGTDSDHHSPKSGSGKMRMTFVVLVCSALTGFGVASSPALAQQKTAKACQAEWQANKADNQTKGISEKAYVAQCRGGGATTPAATPAAPKAPPTAAVPASSPATAPAAKSATAAAANPSGANQFSAEGQAKARCPSDTVVWANLGSKVYHFSGYKNYGNTKNGAYMCEKDAAAQGLRASKTEKHPG